MSHPTSSRGNAYGSHRPQPHWQSSQRRYQHEPRYSTADAAPTYSAGPSSGSTASTGQVWSSNSNSNYSAVYGADSVSSSRSAGKMRSSTQRSGVSKNNHAGLKSKDFSYAFIGKEAEKYAQEALHHQIDNFATTAPIPVDITTLASSPSTSIGLIPAAIVEEFNRAGHFHLARTQLLSSFPKSDYKDFLITSLEKTLLKRISALSPEERKKLNSQDSRVQELEITKWIDESTETADIFDELFEKMRKEDDNDSGLFQSQGAVGKVISEGLADVILDETRRLEQKTTDNSDVENGTPMHKGDLTPAQHSLSRAASHTPGSSVVPD